MPVPYRAATDAFDEAKQKARYRGIRTKPEHSKCWDDLTDPNDICAAIHDAKYVHVRADFGAQVEVSKAAALRLLDGGPGRSQKPIQASVHYFDGWISVHLHAPDQLAENSPAPRRALIINHRMGANMDDIERRTLAATLRRCKGQFARPLGVSREDERSAMGRGFLRFYEWPSGHYEITEAGKEFLSGVEY